MEFHYSLKHNMNSEYEDDDVFYAELRRQILLLTLDEDEDFLDNKHRNCSTVRKQRSNNSASLSSALQHGSYFGWSEFEKNNSVPTWLVNIWRYGNGNNTNINNGTGVFIPRIVQSRRHKPGMLSTRYLLAK